MKASAICATTSALLGTESAAKATEHERTVFKSFDEAVSQYDYDWEVYPVTTDDGYKLNMFRLVGPKEGIENARSTTKTSSKGKKKQNRRGGPQRQVQDEGHFFPERIEALQRRERELQEREDEL